MKTISTEILINTSKEKVWNVLSDFPAYPDWNPFITEISGELKNGARLNVVLKIDEKKETKFNPELISVIPGEKFCWRGKLVMKGVFDGTHYFILEETEDGKTLLTHGENFQGFLAGFILKRIKSETLAAFERMNLAMKEKAEK